MPFDWMRIDKLDSVISILEAGFQDFTKMEDYNTREQSHDAFAYQGNADANANANANANLNLTSHYKMQHTKYKFALPHEYQGGQLDISKFQEKYSRRIARFLEVGRMKEMRKVFVRLGNAKDLGGVGRLKTTLDKLGVMNYEVKYIVLEEWEYTIPKDEPFRWQRDYIPWKVNLILE